MEATQNLGLVWPFGRSISKLKGDKVNGFYWYNNTWKHANDTNHPRTL